MDSARLSKAYNNLVNGKIVNVQKLYGGYDLFSALLPERAIEITKEEYQELSSMNMLVEIRYTKADKKRPCFKTNLVLGMLSFTEIDGRVFATYPDDVWDLEMALMREYIRLYEFFEQVEKNKQI